MAVLRGEEMKRKAMLAVGLLVCAALTSAAPDVRLKDIAQVHGARGNQLIGYGLVVGLEGTGDSKGTLFTTQSVANMLQRFGITVPAGQMKVKNIAAVMVTADLPPFAREGSRIDVTVSSIGDARSLQGGTLLQTPLMGADGNVYAVAQGAISVGGFGAASGGSSQQKNHLTVGRIPAGAIVEREVPARVVRDDSILITLNTPDFTTAARVASAIRQKFPQTLPRALDASTVRVELSGEEREDVVTLIAALQEITVQPDTPARVILNERTGTVVLGGNVTLSPAAVAHGNLTIRIDAKPQVSQPAPLSGGSTVTTTRRDVRVTEQAERLVALPEAVTVEQLVKALNLLGVSPRDLMSILQALRAAGALHAEVEVQ
ncbi:MAG: flagellar basal body P-ring protein FlgI [Armatimonadota bacterium]|nr:flagellar basal body P-ring protein FlgI [Armatimonadota bacterium]